MYSWEWEDFGEIVRSYRPVVNEPGPLKHPVLHFSINRDANLNLTMHTHAPVDAKGDGVSYPPGTVRENTDEVTFVSDRGLELVAKGVQVNRTNMQLGGDPPLDEVRQKCSIHCLRGELSSTDREITYVIDWLANVEPAFIWPDSTHKATEKQTRIRFGDGDDAPAMTGSARPESHSSNCVRLTVDGCTLYLCAATPETAPNITAPGFIFYIGYPSDSFRERVRRCVSLVLGKFLVYLGHSRFCGNWSLIGFEAISPYSIAGRVFNLPAMPPAPLGSLGVWDLDRNAFSRAVNALCRNYDCLNLSIVSWAYWHAVAATPHIAGAHYGAVIESLERAYLNTKRGEIPRSILDGATWNVLRPALDGCVEGLDLKKEIATILKNKISNLNDKPQSLVTDAILSSLGIRLGLREKKALRVRNVSAHGKDADIDIEWIRDVKLLRIRFHRMLLAMTEASEQYNDYFTIGQPVRNLAEAIPEESSEASVPHAG